MILSSVWITIFVAFLFMLWLRFMTDVVDQWLYGIIFLLFPLKKIKRSLTSHTESEVAFAFLSHFLLLSNPHLNDFNYRQFHRDIMSPLVSYPTDLFLSEVHDAVICLTAWKEFFLVSHLYSSSSLFRINVCLFKRSHAKQSQISLESSLMMCLSFLHEIRRLVCRFLCMYLFMRGSCLWNAENAM